ncbi:MAG TPA: dihydropteroate synthase [Gemmataceae bacterium]|nr:dihydropteroate synthase [Gemmataceae bacterium]
MNWRLRNRELHFDSRCLVMGIVNVTPDSFSDGGRFLQHDTAIAQGLELVRRGTDLLDIGGESTRPGSQPISLEEELQRVVPVIAGLAQQCDVPLSIDTSKAEVARACLEAGAHIVNDVTGLTGDPDMPQVVRDLGAGAIVMHMQGTPATMQLAPTYDDVVADIASYFAERLRTLATFGIAPECIALDPGIGFGKTRDHNITLLARLDHFRALGRPLCLGVSRKGFLGRLLDRPVNERVAASLSAAAFALSQDAAQILRVHDVAETRDLAIVWQTLRSARQDACQAK